MLSFIVYARSDFASYGPLSFGDCRSHTHVSLRTHGSGSYLSFFLALRRGRCALCTLFCTRVKHIHLLFISLRTLTQNTRGVLKSAIRFSARRTSDLLTPLESAFTAELRALAEIIRNLLSLSPLQST